MRMKKELVWVEGIPDMTIPEQARQYLGQVVTIAEIRDDKIYIEGDAQFTWYERDFELVSETCLN